MSILVLDSDAHRRRADALALNVKLKILENQKSEIETKIAAAPEAEPLLHPALANVYRKTVAELQTIIHNPETSREAFGLIRGLIDAVILTPVNGELEIELRGDLASILALSRRPRLYPRPVQDRRKQSLLRYGEGLADLGLPIQHDRFTAVSRRPQPPYLGPLSARSGRLSELLIALAVATRRFVPSDA
jgi:hypothetical protein